MGEIHGLDDCGKTGRISRSAGCSATRFPSSAAIIGLWIGLAALFSGLPTLILQFAILQPMLDCRWPIRTSPWRSRPGVRKLGYLSACWAHGFPRLRALLQSSLDPGNHRGSERQAAVFGRLHSDGDPLLLPTIGIGLLVGLGVGICFMLHLIVPGIILLASAGRVAVPVLIQERLGVFGSMSRSACADQGQPLVAVRPFHHPDHRRDRHTMGDRHRRACVVERRWPRVVAPWCRPWCRWCCRSPPRSATSNCARSRKAPASPNWRRYSRREWQPDKGDTPWRQWRWTSAIDFASAGFSATALRSSVAIPSVCLGLGTDLLRRAELRLFDLVLEVR